jgi:Reverse transcriptase (RNA-dependent DNA polymerase)
MASGLDHTVKPRWYASQCTVVFKKRSGVSLSPLNVEETPKTNDPPDKPISCLTLTGDIYQLMVTVRAEETSSCTNSVYGGLDTCGGCNLIRKNQIPYGAVVKELLDGPKIAQAQGQGLAVIGRVFLMMQVEGSTSFLPVHFFVVEKLVVPLLLGTPWIDAHVLRIEPKKRVVVVSFPGSPEPLTVLLRSISTSTSCVLRVAKIRCLPAFSETWVEVRSNKSGLAVLRPSRRRDHVAQVKNGVVEIPEGNQSFRCLVANFGSKPIELSKHQVIGVADSVSDSTTFILAENVADPDEDWEAEIRESVPHLTPEQQEQLLAVLRPNASMWDGHLGQISAVEHHIVTTGPPIASQPYRAGPETRAVIEKEISRMTEMNVIEPASGPWASPIVLIPKPDGSIRFCIDYRKLNEVTENDSYALPRIDDCLDSLGEARFFTTLDANCGYWQIEVSPKDRPKTAFTSHVGLHQFKRLSFGLKTAPATFQRAADVILSSVRFRCALTYIDDIVVYSRTFDQHLEDLELVLRLLRSAGVSLKRRKCTFAAPQVKYLGYFVGREGVQVDLSKIESVRQSHSPTTKTSLRRFLGMTGFYRRFINHYAERAAPLTRYLKKDTEETFQLDSEARDAHADLKEAVTSAPVLALPAREVNMY